jgi:hypothetical protein
MQGLNQDLPLLLSSILEHGASTFGDAKVIGRYGSENIDYDYARLDTGAAACRAQPPTATTPKVREG